jgi:hypothetical protein
MTLPRFNAHPKSPMTLRESFGQMSMEPYKVNGDNYYLILHMCRSMPIASKFAMSIFSVHFFFFCPFGDVQFARALKKF